MNIIKENFTYKLTLIGGKELLLEGHKGITHYEENRVEIRVKGGLLSIEGALLYIEEINEEEVLVKGEITGLGVIKK